MGLADGRTVEYVWDAEGRRVGRKVDGVFTQRLVFEDAMRPAAEVNAAGGVVTRFVYGERLAPEYFVRGGVTYRVLVDHLGSVRLVVNANTGAVVQRLANDPYGRVIENTNPGFQPFGFAGGLYDGDAHLVHFGAREYDPETGRWLTRDPLLFDGGDTNLYGYVLGDPVNLTDPAGLFALPSLQSVSDFAAGFGDTISFGITREIREVLGSNSAVNFCSAAYRAGGNSGEAYAMVLPGPKVPRLRFSPDQDALIQLAKESKKRGGLTAEEGRVMRAWADEYDVPARGPESHPGRGFGASPHYHVGPVNHIPQR